MDSPKMCSFVTKICMKLAISRGMRADPPEGGAGGIKAVRPEGDGGWMRDAGGSPALWLSFLVGYPIMGKAGGITGEVA
jgi:hypothetical protein